jgi:hypothetical protein
MMIPTDACQKRNHHRAVSLISPRRETTENDQDISRTSRNGLVDILYIPTLVVYARTLTCIITQSAPLSFSRG